MIVVADSGPLHYLILLDQTELLHRFYGQVVVAGAVAGTLGILRIAAEQELIDVPEVLARLRGTNFYVAEDLIRSILGRWLGEGSE